MKRQFSACQSPRSMYRTHMCSTVSQLFEPQVQKLQFSRTAAHIFPLETPLRLSRNMLHGWKDNACQTPRSMYLSVFNSFRVIRCLSQCVSPKITIFTTFWFSLGTPLGQSRQTLYGWKENLMLINCLGACAHLTITVSEIQQDIRRKSSIFSYPPCIRRTR